MTDGRRPEFGPSIPIARLGGALRWLHERAEVSISRLATVFEISPLHVRQLLYRDRIAAPRRSPAPRTVSRIRVPNEAPEHSPWRDRRIDELHATISTIREQYEGSTEYLIAAHALKQLNQFRGFPSTPRWLELMARIGHERAWFLVHAGHVSSARAEALQSMALNRLAAKYARTTGDACVAWARVADTGLMLSHAWLLAGNPDAALRALEIVEAAADTAGQPPRSDYHRQRGVALFQLGADAGARRHFERSERQMEAYGEARHPLELPYTGARHWYLLDQNWEHAANLAIDIRQVFGALSLHASVAAHWAVATGLSADSSAVHDEAFALLETNRPVAQTAFGHQATLSYVLSRTPMLGLDPVRRREWLRRALYVNAFRQR